MQEKSTDELDAQLRNTTPDCMDKYYKENRYLSLIHISEPTRP